MASSLAGASNSNNYQQSAELLQLFTTGVNGRFEPIVAWLKGMYESLNELTALVAGDTRALFYVCGTLRCGLLCATHSDVVHWTCRVLSRFAFLLVCKPCDGVTVATPFYSRVFSFVFFCFVCIAIRSWKLHQT